MVHDDLGMKNLLLDLLVVVVGDGSDEPALRKRTDFAGGNQFVHLRVDRRGATVRIDAYAFSLLENFPETLAEFFSRGPQNLPGNNVAYRAADHLALFISIIARELREVLNTEADGDLIAAGRSDQIVESFDIERRQLVQYDSAWQPVFAVDEFDDSLAVEAQGTRIDVLAIGVAADA